MDVSENVRAELEHAKALAFEDVLQTYRRTRSKRLVFRAIERQELMMLDAMMEIVRRDDIILVDLQGNVYEDQLR